MARNVVISGGGTGIGRAAARVFAADGDRVLLLGRRADVMGGLVNRRPTTVLMSTVAGGIIALNVYLLCDTFLR